MMVFSFKSMAAAFAPDPSGVVHILWEALQLPCKSLPLFLPLLAITVSSSSLLFLSTFSAFSPLLTDLFTKLSSLLRDPRGPDLPRLLTDIHRDLKDFAVPGSLATLAAAAVSLLLMVAIVYTFSMAYTDNPLTPDALLKRVSARWYQTLVTRLYVVVLSLGYMVLSSVVIGTAMLVSSSTDGPPAPGPGPRWSVPHDLGKTLAGLGLLLYMYLWTRWAMSMVVAVVEETWGIGALSMSVELFIGNKRRGTLLTCIVAAGFAAIVGVFVCAVVGSGPPPMPIEEQQKLGLATVIAASLWGLYALAVYTVFYHECMKTHGKEEARTAAVIGGGGFMYSALPDHQTLVKVEAVIA